MATSYFITQTHRLAFAWKSDEEGDSLRMGIDLALDGWLDNIG